MDDVVDLKKTVEDAIGLPVGPSTPMQYSVTGEYYVEILSGGSFVDNRRPAWYATEDLAIGAYLDAVKKYAALVYSTRGPGASLYWRTPPEITEHSLTHCWPNGEELVYSVYSRLLISPAKIRKVA